MKNRKFYIVDAKNVTKGYDFISDGYNSKFASKKCLCEIFDSYGLPKEAQVIFVEDFLFKFKLTDAKEFVTDTNLDISSLKWKKTTEGKTIVCGRSINDYDMIKFKVNKNNYCNYTELINFFRKLDRLDILDNYVYAVEEAFRKDYIIDEKLENIKLLIK